MLHKDVREAVKKQEFFIYPVQQVEDVMRLLCGLEPGRADAKGAYPQKSFNYRVQQRIEKLQKMQKQYARQDDARESSTASGKKQ